MNKCFPQFSNKRQEYLYCKIKRTEETIINKDVEDYIDVTEYIDLTHAKYWTEEWPDKNGEVRNVNVEAIVWSEAIQTAIEKYNKVYIPYMEEPVYIDKPIILGSNSCLKIHPRTEIRLKPFTNTCMVRNKNIVCGDDKIVQNNPNYDITIEGGIWTTLANGQIGRNGNIRGNADKDASIYGAHGVILMHNVRNIKIFNITIKESAAFGIHIGNAENFLIETVNFIENRRDGIHVDGPAKNGIIRNISGNTGDDIIALNSWDWKYYSVSFGSITDIIVENVKAYSNEIRLLAGKKKFNNEVSIECDIKRCIFKNIKGVYNFKIYCQPNIEALIQGEIDKSETAGYLEDIYFEEIHIQKPKATGLHGIPIRGIFEICADIHSIVIKNVKIYYPLENFNDKTFPLVCIGPMSFTWKKNIVNGRVIDTEKPENWNELFDPNIDCTVQNMLLENILIKSNRVNEEFRKCTYNDELVKIICQKLNPDYPNTTPKGGVGKGYIVNLFRSETK